MAPEEPKLTAAVPSADDGGGRDPRVLARQALDQRATFDVSEDALTAFLAERLAAGAQPRHAGDLLLALGCLRRDRTAIRELRDLLERVAVRVDSALAGKTDARGEVVQQVQLLLLMGRTGNRPYLASYGGRASLFAWLKVVVARHWVAVRRGQAAHREEELADYALDALARADVDGELTFARDAHAREFRRAFGESLRELDDRDRRVLRFHLHERLTADEIGVRFGVHRVTVARWFQRIRARLLADTRRRLRRQLGVDQRELDSILAAIASRMDASFSGLASEQSDR